MANDTLIVPPDHTIKFKPSDPAKRAAYHQSVILRVDQEFSINASVNSFASNEAVARAAILQYSRLIHAGEVSPPVMYALAASAAHIALTYLVK